MVAGLFCALIAAPAPCSDQTSQARAGRHSGRTNKPRLISRLIKPSRVSVVLIGTRNQSLSRTNTRHMQHWARRAPGEAGHGNRPRQDTAKGRARTQRSAMAQPGSMSAWPASAKLGPVRPSPVLRRNSLKTRLSAISSASLFGTQQWASVRLATQVSQPCKRRQSSSGSDRDHWDDEPRRPRRDLVQPVFRSARRRCESHAAGVTRRRS